VADQVDLLDVEVGEGLVHDLGQARRVAGDVQAGAVVVVGHDALRGVAVGHEAHGVGLDLLGGPGEAVHEDDRQGDVVGQRRQRVGALRGRAGPACCPGRVTAAAVVLGRAGRQRQRGREQDGGQGTAGSRVGHARHLRGSK